jgi:4-hydroxythreonine-4-phosphate dehydrogenase
MTKTRKKLGITMGDPAGVGPEIIVKALLERHVHDLCQPIVIGDPECMRRAVKDIVKTPMEIRVIASPDRALGEFGVMEVLPISAEPLAALPLGKVDARCGEAAFRSVEAAIRLAMRGELDGTVTAPLNKEAMNLAGHHFDGHTEIYATLTGVKQYAMMLADGNLRVVHVSTHLPLAQASSRITFDRVLEVIRLGNDACRKIGIPAPRVGVAGFNPHAGENGLFGTEEQEYITPAIVAAKNEGIDVTGPLSPDTVFCKAAGGGFDIVVAMYHDQGHIPLKMLGFKYDGASNTWSGMTGVNITLGLPIVRASVDHGTAFGKAGKNTASPLSMIHAIEYGAMLAGAALPHKGE